jgi:hypothetical protein
MSGKPYCTRERTPNTHTQPIINQIKRNIAIVHVAITFKHTPQLAIIVNALESGMKHINVLKRRIKLIQETIK